MNSSSQFKRRALLLFLITSLMPALTVSVLWYSLTSDVKLNFVTIDGFVIPIALIGLVPAIAVGLLFAEALAIPIRRLHQGITRMAKGEFGHRISFSRILEFREMAESLNTISMNMQQTLSQSSAENDLIAAERNKLRAVLDSMTDGVLALDYDNRVMLFNRAAIEITGRSLGSIAGQRVDKLNIFQADAGIHPLLDWLKDSSSAASIHWKGLKVERLDGSVVYADVYALRTTPDPNGIKVLVTFHDITKGHQLEEMEVNFIALAAHELRTPVTMVEGYLDIFRSELGTSLNLDQQELLERCIGATRHLHVLTENLLSVSHIERGEAARDLEPTNWADFLRQLIPALTSRASDHGRKLIVDIPKELAVLRVDQVSMSEVIDNLIDNAIRYTNPKGTIRISAKTTIDGIETTVSDNGIGIAKDAIPKLFTKFYRVEGLKTRGGNGLGLYIIKALVEAHHGYVWVDSKLGKGTTFGFNLPIPKPAKLANKTVTKRKHV